MKYIKHDIKIGPQSLEVDETSVPSYNPEKERLIKVEASAVNRADLLQVR
jgi:NADPH:quinone reductase-like Zn-dependent oxidoreductase